MAVKLIRGSVRTKILAVVLVALLLPAVVVFVEGRVLLASIAPLEHETLNKQRLRFERLVETERAELVANDQGWSIWDEFYDYLDDPEAPEWVAWRTVNIDEYVPEFHEVDFIVIADRAGRVLYQHGDLPEYAVGTDLSATPLFREAAEKKLFSGFLRTSTGYVLIAASTVHRTADNDQSGPWNGVYVIGRTVDATYLDSAFGGRMLAPVAVHADGVSVPSEDDARPVEGNGSTTRSFTGQEMTISFPLTAVLFDAPTPTVSVTESRSLFRIAFTQLLQTTVVMTVLVLGTLLAIFLFFESLVFRPLFRFLAQVEESGRAGKLAAVAVARTGDEFEHLTKTYNAMVEAVSKAEDQLLVSQKFLRTVLETVPLPIVVVDQASDHVIMVNPAGRALLVGTVGKDWTDFLAFLKGVRRMDGGAYPAAKMPYLAAKTGGRTAQADDVMLQLGGKPVFYSVTAQPLAFTRGDRPQVLMAFFDISKQREVERLRTEFADIVAHQLRSPLTSLKWAVEAAEGAKPAERAAYLAEIATTVDRTLTLINQLLQIARLAAGRLKFRVSPIAVRSVVDATSADLRPQVAGKRIRLTVDVPKPLRVMADATLLQEVLRNLLSNAVAYTPEDGEVAVSAVADDGTVAVTVRDTGIGIPADEQERIFEKFFRASNAMGTGTGLGLATVKEFTEAMGGQVGFESAVGKGSAFTVRLRSAKGA